MSSVNKVILLGRLGRDPNVRYLPDGKPVASFGLATTEQWKDKNGEKQSRTEWHQIKLFGRLADIASQYLKKGSLAYFEGRIESEEGTDSHGVTRRYYNIVCHEMKMIGGQSNDGAQNSNEPTPAPPGRSSNTSPVVNDLNDEDIPF